MYPQCLHRHGWGERRGERRGGGGYVPTMSAQAWLGGEEGGEGGGGGYVPAMSAQAWLGGEGGGGETCKPPAKHDWGERRGERRGGGEEGGGRLCTRNVCTGMAGGGERRGEGRGDL